MALSKNTTIDRIEIEMGTGAVLVESTKQILEDGEVIVVIPIVKRYAPGDDITALPNKLTKYVNYIWANL